MKTQGAQFLRRRKFLLVLPLLTLPFITLAFWALGVGQTSEQPTTAQQGLNPSLPDAKPSSDPTDKMSLYNQAARDSMARKQEQGFDPYATPDATDTALAFHSSANSYGYSPGLRSYSDPNEVKVQERLASLERALREPAMQQAPLYPPAPGYGQGGMGSDLDRLEQMMQSMSGNGKPDPEMQQLSEMMEKVLDLQYPGRAQQKLQELSQKNKGRVYPVHLNPENHKAGIIKRPDKVAAARATDTQEQVAAPNAFYSLAGNAATDTTRTAIPAVVHETQTIVSGGTLKLRLTEDIFVSGVLIPAGNFIYGAATINGERLKIEISGVRYGKSLFPVALTIYDLDAIEGIRIPGAMTRDAAKEGADRALQSVQLMTMDPSIATQAAGAGVEVAKGLFGKKAKLVRVTVKAGYPVLLMDAKTKQEQSY